MPLMFEIKKRFKTELDPNPEPPESSGSISHSKTGGTPTGQRISIPPKSCASTSACGQDFRQVNLPPSLVLSRNRPAEADDPVIPTARRYQSVLGRLPGRRRRSRMVGADPL
jgi:hypothetical protein